jgi:hypothetical protein
MGIFKALAAAYRELIAAPSRQIPFWILAGFLPTFLIARLIVDTSPGLFLMVHGTHVHHFTYGIVALAVTGFISLVLPQQAPRMLLAVFYGVGLALSFDEFGMWIHLTANYQIDQSEDVMVGILVFLIVTVYGLDILRRAIFHRMSSRGR